MGRTAAGVRAMSLGKKDEVIGMVAIGDEDKYIFTASEKGYGKKTETGFYRKTRRGGKGLINLKITPKIGHALGVLGVAEEDLLVVTVSGKVIRIQDQAGQGVGPGDPGRPADQPRGEGPGLLRRQGRGSGIDRPRARARPALPIRILRLTVPIRQNTMGSLSDFFGRREKW